MNKTIKIFCLCFFTTVFLVGCEQQNPPVNNPTPEVKVTPKNDPILKTEDTISKLNKIEIISFLFHENINIISGPVLQVDYSVLQISGKDLKGYVGWASQGESEYYISGSLRNDQYIGDVYRIGSNKVIGKFQLKIQDQKLKLKGGRKTKRFNKYKQTKKNKQTKTKHKKSLQKRNKKSHKHIMLK